MLANTTPLLEEEPYTSCLTLIADRTNPRDIHRAGTVSTLATDDHPVDVV